MGPGRPADRLQPVLPYRRGARLRQHRSADLVRTGRDLFRHPGLRGARGSARHPRRPRQDRLRRLRPDPARHLRRRTPGHRVRGEPPGGPVRRRPGRDRVGARRQRLHQCRGAAGNRRSEPRLRLRVERAGHQLGLRGGSPDSVQESALPGGAGADLGPQRDPPGPALRARGLLGPRSPSQRIVPGPGRPPGRPHRPASRAGARPESLGHQSHHRCPQSHGVGLPGWDAPSSAAPCAGGSATT